MWDRRSEFDENGLLPAIEGGEFGKDARAPSLLAASYVLNQTAMPSEVPPSVLPTMLEDQIGEVTTSQSVMVLQDARHGMLLVTMDTPMLWRVVEAIREKHRTAGELKAPELEFMKVGLWQHGCEKGAEVCWRCVGSVGSTATTKPDRNSEPARVIDGTDT